MEVFLEASNAPNTQGNRCTKHPKNKKPSKKEGLGGIERIRTAVQAFAELCLATRPRCHNLWTAKVAPYYKVSKIYNQDLLDFRITVTFSTSPLIGGFTLETATFELSTVGNS